MTLLQAREAKGWTQEQLQRETEQRGQRVDQRTISRLERGEAANPRNDTVESLENALELERGCLIFHKRTSPGNERRRHRDRRADRRAQATA